MGLLAPPLSLSRVVIAAVGKSPLNSSASVEEHDYDYIFDCKVNCNKTEVAASLSCNYINLYDPNSLNYISKLSGHRDTINDIQYSAAMPNILLSSSSDGTVRLWDTRSTQTGTTLKIGTEVWSADFGCGGGLVGLGTNDFAQFYDLRNPSKKLGEYGESHADAITIVRFHPVQNDHVFTASEDGVVCLFDCGISDEDDAVKAILNAESSIRKLALCGSKLENVALLTGTETLSVWNVEEGARIVNFENPRQDVLSTHQVTVDYLVDCKYDNESQKLFCVAGNHAGQMFVFDVQSQALQPVCSLEGGHKACVRTVFWDDERMITGGEDSRLCLWQRSSQGCLDHSRSPSSVIRAGAEHDSAGLKVARKSSRPY